MSRTGENDIILMHDYYDTSVTAALKAVDELLKGYTLVESWGTGIKRIMKAAGDYGLPAPEFQVFDDMFRVNLFRNLSPMNDQKNNDDSSENHRRTFVVSTEKI